MKKIINGKMYNTETAKKVGGTGSNGIATNDFKFWCEELYLKKTGEYFLSGEGGAMTSYAVSCGNNNTGGSEVIVPYTETEAKEWAERHLDGDEYEAIFGVVEE